MRVLLSFFSAFLFGAIAHAETKEIDWSDLIDPAVVDFDDPFQDLTYDQLADLRRVAIAREKLAAQSQTEDAKTEAENVLGAADARLRTAGIDVDWMLEQRWIVAARREAAFTSGNPAVDGKTIRLSGYAIPGTLDLDGSRVAYIVPERGMCSHTPPPNPNQLVRVRLKDDWQPRMLHEPVRLTGQLQISPSAYVVQVVDGPVNMISTFTMEVDSVETIGLFDDARNSEWLGEMQKNFARRFPSFGRTPNPYVPPLQ